MLRTIGLMSGTSLDGVDAAWLETDGERIGGFGPTLTLPYDDRLRADLRRILDHAPNLDPMDRRLKTAVARLTDYHVRAVAALGREADLIGFHGQTILHQPDRRPQHVPFHPRPRPTFRGRRTLPRLTRDGHVNTVLPSQNKSKPNLRLQSSGGR